MERWGDVVKAAAQMKLNSILESDEGLAERFQAETDRIASEFNKIPETAAERLVGYRAAIGNEMFEQLASNPKLQEMADVHWKEIAKADFNKMVDGIHAFFEGHDISRDDIYNALVGMTGML